MRKVSMFLLSMLLTTNLFALEPLKIQVWPQGAAETSGITEPEKYNAEGHLFNSQSAEMFVCLPEEKANNRTAVLICPGGGYGMLAMQHEGFKIAKILNEKGIVGIVLKYRLPNGHKEIPLKDAQEAMKIIRANAEKWQIDPAKVGVMGFSAGGHLASTLGTHFDAMSRPDFMILFYPVIQMTDMVTHGGSKNNLLGKDRNDPKWVDYYSNEKQVSKQTPPTLLLLSDNDDAVPPLNSTSFYEALKKERVPASMYIFPEGRHGWGANENFAYYKDWQDFLFRWLKFENFSNK